MVSGQHHIHNSILISGQSSSWYINNDEKTNNEWTEYNLEDLMARCLKITEKVSFKIASEASYVYILSGQKLVQNAKNGPFRRVLKTRSLRSNSVTRQVSLNRTKIDEKCQNSINQMRHFEQFSNNVKTWWDISFIFPVQVPKGLILLLY